MSFRSPARSLFFAALSAAAAVAAPPTTAPGPRFAAAATPDVAARAAARQVLFAIRAGKPGATFGLMKKWFATGVPADAAALADAYVGYRQVAPDSAAAVELLVTHRRTSPAGPAETRFLPAGPWQDATRIPTPAQLDELRDSIEDYLVWVSPAQVADGSLSSRVRGGGEHGYRYDLRRVGEVMMMRKTDAAGTSEAYSIYLREAAPPPAAD